MTVTTKPLVISDADLRRLQVADLRIDTAYQRDLEAPRVQRITNDYDPRRFDPILVSSRGRVLWVVDGQHRIAALREMGIGEVQAIILTGLTQREEADLFVLRQRDRKGLNAWDLFKAATVAGHEDVLTVTRVVRANGFKIDRSNGHAHIQAVGALRRIYKLGGELLLGRTLQTIRAVWSGDTTALNGVVIEGLALFFYAYQGEPQFSSDRSSDLLSKTPPARVIREARRLADLRGSVTTSATYVAEAVRELYNHRLSGEKKLRQMRVAR